MSSGRKSKSRIFNSDWERVFNKNIGRYLQVIITELSILQNNEIDTELNGKISLRQINDINRKKHSPIKMDEIPFKIPFNWKWFRLGDIGICKTGTTPPTIESDNFGSDIPFIKPADITLSGIVYDNEALSYKGLNKGVLIPKNSLLMVCIGGSIGKSYYNSIDVSCNQQINTITPFPGNNVAFFQNFLQSEYFQKAIWAKASGGTTPIVNRSKWESILVPLPPSIEQDKIVAFLNDLEKNQLNDGLYFNKEVENIIINIHHAQLKGFTINFELTHQINLIKKLRQKLLEDAVQGKLVEQDPNDEDAIILLKKIKAEKEQLINDRKLKKEKGLPPINEDEIPFEIPKNWAWCRLGELANEILGGYSYDSTSYSKVETDNQVIRLGNVKPNKLVLKTGPTFISDEYAIVTEKARLHVDDILITMTGTRAKKDYLFSHCLTPGDFTSKKLYLNQRVGCLRFGKLIFSQFINLVLKNAMILKPVFETSTGAANQANIGIAALKEILIPYPPREEQNRIIQKLEQLIQTCDALEASIKQSQQQNEQLLQQVLREALTKEVKTGDVI